MNIPGREQASSLLSSIKSRMGFGRSREQGGDYLPEGDDYEGYDDYEDYGDNASRRGRTYGSFGDYEDFDTYADYGEYGYTEDVELTSSLDGSRSYDPQSSGRFGSENSRPRLVSMEEARASMRVPESLSRDSRDGIRGKSSALRGRTMVDSSLPAAMTPEGTAAASAAAAEATAAFAGRSRTRSEGASSVASGSFYTPDPSVRTNATGVYGAHRGSAGVRRSVHVLQPTAYGDVQVIAGQVKNGGVVVLDLRKTSDALSKRILDFSFGVASALDATVECVDDSVFVLSAEGSLTDAERMDLRSQGVL